MKVWQNTATCYFLSATKYAFRQIPAEVLSMIMEYCTNGELYNLSRVNYAIKIEAERALYHKIALHSVYRTDGIPDALNCLITLVESANKAKLVHTLYFNCLDSHVAFYELKALSHLLCAAIPQLEILKHLDLLMAPMDTGEDFLAAVT